MKQQILDWMLSLAVLLSWLALAAWMDYPTLG